LSRHLTAQGSSRADSSRPVLLGAVLLFVTLLGAAGLKSYRDLNAARAHEQQLESRIEETRNGIDRLRGRIDRLRGDPAMLERLAREDLGLVRRQDVVIELPRDPAPAPGQPPARP
jgi:cell division protein FtsB